MSGTDWQSCKTILLKSNELTKGYKNGLCNGYAGRNSVLAEVIMSTTMAHAGGNAIPQARTRPAYQAYQILHAGFVAAPALAGLDKFFHLLTNWDQYLAPWVAHASPIGGHQLMLG